MDRATEARTVACMIGVYCRGEHHGKKDQLCPECQELLDYARYRLSKCPHGDEKPFCSHCTIHCYKPDMKEKIRKVMRYSGPRMMFYHPVIAFRHLAQMQQDKRRAAS